MKLPDDVREFFRKQGSIGGKRKNAKLSAEERSEAARHAAAARWAAHKQDAAVKDRKAEGRKSK